MSWWSSRNKKTEESEASEEEAAAEVESVPPVVSGILGLQQASGNQSVQSLLTPNKTASATVDNLIDSPAKRESAGIRIHTDDHAAESADSVGAAAYTRGRDIYFGAGKYAPSTSEGRELLAHELVHALHGEPGQELSENVASTEVVPASAPSEREAESKAKSHQSETALSGEPSHTPAAIHRVPLTDAEMAQKLHDAMTGKSVNATAIINLLTGLNRDATKIKKIKDAYSAAFNKDLEAELRLALGSDSLAHALFLMNAPAPETPISTVSGIKPGTEKHTAKVGDGEVSVRTDVEFKLAERTFTEGFSVGYTGAKAEDSRWLQFLWSEIISTQEDGSVKRLAANGLPISKIPMDLTTDPKDPKYHVDSARTDNPFFESGSTTIRSAKASTIYDRPYEFADLIEAELNKGATKVVEKDHFADFLVRDYKTIYKVSLTVTWEYTSKTNVTRSTKFESGSAVTGLPSDYKKALVKAYPKFDYIQ